MSTELKAVEATKHSESISVTRFAAHGGAKLQLTQGIGCAMKGETGFIHVNAEQALELIATLAQFVSGKTALLEEQYLESLHEEA